MHYEGGPQWATGNNYVSGVNSVNSTDINALAAQMTALGWNVSAYTVSGTNNTYRNGHFGHYDATGLEV